MEQIKNEKLITEVDTMNVSTDDGIKGKAEKKAGKRIGYNYIIIKSLKKSQKNDVVKCLYIKSLTDFGFCVIKEGTYGDTKDKYGRDITDRLIWQQQLHGALHDKVRLPRLLGHFEENGNYYLVIERIKGQPLYKAIREKNGELREGLINGTKAGLTFMNYLVQIVNLVDTLHLNGVVHRDATANNFIITPNGKVAVIDMELSYNLKQKSPAPPFQLGTYGYMSPEQLKTAIPTIKEDVFAVGAVVMQVWTGISPSKITDVPIEDLCKKVHFFVPDEIIADTIVRCLHPEAKQRPSLKEVHDLLTQYTRDLHVKKQRPPSRIVIYSKNQIKETVQSALDTLSSSLLADEEKGWFSEDTHSELNRDKSKINKAWYASFSRGATGVMYLMNQAQNRGFDVKAADPHIQKALSLIETKYINRIEQVSPSLHFGAPGIAATLFHAFRDGLIQPQTHYFDWINLLLHRENKAFGFTHGITGQGIAHLLCQDFLQESALQQRLQEYVSCLLQHQQKDGSWTNMKLKKTNKEKKHLGFATGVAGIVYFLLEYAQHYQDAHVFEAARHGLQWLVKRSAKKGNLILWRTDKNKELMHWWGEGKAGIALAFMKAYSYLNDETFKHYATSTLLNNPPQVIDNNLSQLAGLSGLGEIYLEGHRTFGDAEWMKRADWIAQVIMHLKKEDPQHGPYWLVQHERQPTPDFMTGNSGVVHFLLRYCYPDMVRLPLLP
ncbi:protein kinase/lanthionine synthetase C family protein [Niastella populi]|nr:protein kinase/lanthionine synthetase C family protein [Niastella populi]